MSDEKRNVTVNIVAPIGWFSGWMFAIGFAQLGVGRALLALVTWPYYVGASLVP